jgi:thymidylate synthase (FAD)
MINRSHNVEIEIYPLAKTVVDRVAVRRWLDDMDAVGFQVPEPEACTDAALLVALAAKQCYMSFEPGLNPNVTKVRENLVDYLDNILASGHGSVLEHASFTLAINGVSRVFTAEMNRHRAGWAISERSMRFIRFEHQISWWMPLSLRENAADDSELADRKRKSRELFHQMFSYQSETYAHLVDIWDMDAGDKNFHYKKTVTSCLRRIIGMGCATGGVWTGNVRALRHVLAMRASSVAEEEICHVFSRVAELVVDSEPMIFGDFKQDDRGFWKPKYAKV